MSALTPCPGCGRMTLNVRYGRADHRCNVCQAQKMLSNVYWYETTKKEVR